MSKDTMQTALEIILLPFRIAGTLLMLAWFAFLRWIFGEPS